MSGLVVLVGHSLWRRRWFLLAELVVLFLFQILFVVAARSLEASGGFAEFARLLPAFMQQWAGVMMSSFRGLVLLGYSHPIVVLLLVATAITIATECTEEIESRFVDLVMARPIARSTAITRSIVVLTIVLTAAIASMMLGTWAGLSLLAPANAAAPAPRLVASLAAELALVVFAWGGIALAIASLSVRRANAGAIAGLLAVAMFILAILGEFWSAARPVTRVSPFGYYHPSQLIGGAPLNWTDVGVLAAIAVGGCTIAYVAYMRRDL